MTIESNKNRMRRLRRAFDEGCRHRDRKRCVMCGRGDVKLSVHHITDRHAMPNHGYAMSNGITLCDEGPSPSLPSCHMKAEAYHISGGRNHVPAFHPDELYARIRSSKDQAVQDSEALR